MKKLMATLILAGLATSVSAAGIHIEDGWARATVEG
ncbi:MAG: copper chaperone PCu(A)C, partial [Neisseria subflava]|nr:copper chaperone PCu(A)C [Neisseria subflava]